MKNIGMKPRAFMRNTVAMGTMLLARVVSRAGSVIFCITAIVSMSAAATATYHVAPKGDDSNSGSLDAPFASLHKACDAARGRGNVTVFVHPGLYRWERPLELTAEDSGLTIQAAGDEKPIISGGQRITRWKQTDDGLWHTRLPDERKRRFDQLFVNGKRAVRAREPDRFYFHFADVREEVLEKGNGRVPRRATQTLSLRPEEFALLESVADDERGDVVVVAYHKWDITRRAIKALDAEASAVVVGDDGMKPWNALRPGTRCHIENFRAALDTPGEWFLDRDGTLYYYPLPGEDMETVEVVAPVLDRFIVIKGDPGSGAYAQSIDIRGLAFRHAAAPADISHFGPVQAAADIEAAIMVDGARSVGIEDCEVAHVGGYGVWFRGGCRDCALRRSYIHDLGAGGVRIGETSQPAGEAEQTGAVVVDNNIIRDGGHIYIPAVGVWIGHSPDNRISHNEVADFFYTGISVGWRWGYAESLAKRNTIEFNRIRHIGQGVLSDMGGIYTLGPSQGTVVRNNVFHDVYSYGYGGWGLYTDEGSTGILFENNLVYNVKTGGFHQHYGKENIVRNNILAFSRLYQLQATRVEEHLSFTLENNIVYWDSGVLLRGAWDRIRHRSRSNCFWRVDGESVAFLGRDLEEWQNLGREEGSIVADPQFADPEEFRFGIPNESPALEIGFTPFDPAEAGVYGAEAWRRRADEKTWSPLEMPPPPPAGVPRSD